MKNRLLWAVIPAAGLLLLGGAMRSRFAALTVPQTTMKNIKTATAPAVSPPRSIAPALPAAPPVVAAASEDARIRSTYQNFRIAVATENHALVKALEPAVARDRATMLQHAEGDLARVEKPSDRQITLKTLEALRRAR